MKIISSWEFCCLVQLLLFSGLWGLTSSLGSMSSIAISYGENGSVFCGLKSDGSHSVTCYGSNSAIVYGTPAHLQFTGLTAGDGFMCGLLMESQQPYCWGNSVYIHMGVPQPMTKGTEYLEISAGDYHLCALRKYPEGARQDTNYSLVDCWGYKMTRNYVFDGQMHSISAGYVFNCGLFSNEKTVFCWGNEATTRITSLIPKKRKFEKIAAGSYHVCGIQEDSNSRVFCWGKSLGFQEDMTQRQGSDVDLPPKEPLVSVVGGKFHACGIKSNDLGVICWGFIVNSSTPIPKGIKFSVLAAGDYFTCGVPAERFSLPVCWGQGFPKPLPLPVPIRICRSTPCAPGTYEQSRLENSPCKSPGTHICLPCSTSCPPEMYLKRECTSISDQICVYNCSGCFSPECSSNCSSSLSNGRKYDLFLKLPFIVAELSFVLFVITVASMIAILYVRCRLRNCHCSAKDSKPKKDSPIAKNHGKIGPELERLKLRRAKMFTYKELAIATGMFEEESLIGKGSFSCVYKGILKNGINVAVKKATMSSDQQKNLKEFHTELDLLSRLNHAHLLNLLGYCEEGGERLLVYEFMAHGSLYNHLHGKDRTLKEQMSWVRRVTIAVQAARGIEYLHGYACPPVIHRDIKSSNILIDEEFNARVADFGLSLLGPADSSSPLAELPAGTLGYLDPEYYRLHYLTTKSDVYSFGVLLLELLSGRKAIDLQYEQGNIVEWAVPLVKSGDLSSILDPVLNPDLNPPTISEALRRIANVACKCVKMRGRDRPSMDKVTTALERSLTQLMGSPSLDQPILPSEVVLGSRRMHKKKSSTTSSNQSFSEAYDQGTEFRAPSWITFPSVASSQRRKSSVSEGDVVGLGEGRNQEMKNENGVRCDFVLRKLEEEIGPASPQQDLFLQHNF